MVWADVDDRIDLVAKRVDVLEVLTDAPRYKPALVEALGHSRSTVDRAIRRLEGAGLVERTDEGFRATLAGRLAAERYRAFVADERAVLDGVDFLRSLPPDCDLPHEAVRESRTETFESPVRAFEVLVEPLRTGDRYVAVLPRLYDSRLLRLCHARVRGDGMDAELLVTARVLERLRAEFPRITADLATTDGVRIRRVDEPCPYTLTLADDAETTVSVVSTDGDATGVLTTTTQSGVEWAESTLADVRADATDETDDLATLVDDLDETPLGRHERRGPSGLSDVGVERLDATYFSRRTPNDPVTGWRVGFDLVDVYYGHPFERHHRPDAADPAAGGTTASETATTDGRADATRAVEHLVETLADGENRVVLGPPGSGKSTLCRQVACRWVAGGYGPVFYRTTPVDTAFDRPAALTAALEEADGHALVVVEDGADETTAGRLGPVLERARDDPTVSVLLESRSVDWPPTGTDPRGETLFRNAVSGYRLAGLDEGECHDAVAAFEAATGREIPRSGSDLFETLRDGDGPGDCHLLGHRLAAYTRPAPWSDASTEPTGLDADARGAYERVAPDGPDDSTLALEVGLLAAVMSASKRAVTPAALHTVAAARADTESEGAHRRVDATIDDLRGVLLFERESGTRPACDADGGTRAVRTGSGATREQTEGASRRDERGAKRPVRPKGRDAFRTQHPSWAARFLETALEAEDRTTVAAFERALSALFAPADDATVRERIESWFGRPLDDLDRVETDVDDVVDGLFGVVTRYTSLVPLFGTTEFSGIELPDACSAETRLEARGARLFGWYKYGDLDRVEREAEALLDAIEDEPAAGVDDRSAARFEVRARRRLADVADDRGDAGAAREHLETGLSVIRGTGDRRSEARLLTSLGMVELHADAYDAAEAYLREADRVGEPLGPSPERSATVYYLGRLHRKRGEYEAAEERLTEALEIDRQCESLPPSDAAATLNALGTVAVDRGAHDRAESYYRQALELQREANNRRGVATTLVNLGDLAVETGDVGVAASCFEEALDVAGEVETVTVQGAALGGLGRVATARGDLDAAAEFHRERTSVDDSPRSLAIAERYLGDVAAERGDLETARSRYETAAEAFVDLGALDRAAATAMRLVETCAETNATAAARAWTTRVRELASDADLAEYREEAAAWDERLASD